MKKRLEAELISIAHRILKLKSKSELDQLYVESRKLYETLSVLKFVEDNVHAIQPKVSDADIEKMIDNSHTIIDTEIVEEETLISKEESIIEEELTKIEAEPTADLSTEKQNLDVESDTDVPEVATADIEEVEIPADAKVTQPKISFEPDMDYSAEFVKKEVNTDGFLSFDKKPELTFEKAENSKVQEISFDELLGYQANEPQFEKKEEASKQTTLNEALGKSSHFGLNDRIGFVKNLFDGSEEDFNRVVSQLGTLDNADEVKSFISELVKPDYSNWENKEDFEIRFMEIILNRFS